MNHVFIPNINLVLYALYHCLMFMNFNWSMKVDKYKADWKNQVFTVVYFHPFQPNSTRNSRALWLWHQFLDFTMGQILDNMMDIDLHQGRRAPERGSLTVFFLQQTHCHIKALNPRTLGIWIASVARANNPGYWGQYQALGHRYGTTLVLEKTKA